MVKLAMTTLGEHERGLYMLIYRILLTPRAGWAQQPAEPVPRRLFNFRGYQTFQWAHVG